MKTVDLNALPTEQLAPLFRSAVPTSKVAAFPSRKAGIEALRSELMSRNLTIGLEGETYRVVPAAKKATPQVAPLPGVTPLGLKAPAIEEAKKVEEPVAKRSRKLAKAPSEAKASVPAKAPAKVPPKPEVKRASSALYSGEVAWDLTLGYLKRTAPSKVGPARELWKKEDRKFRALAPTQQKGIMRRVLREAEAAGLIYREGSVFHFGKKPASRKAAPAKAPAKKVNGKAPSKPLSKAGTAPASVKKTAKAPKVAKKTAKAPTAPATKRAKLSAAKRSKR